MCPQDLCLSIPEPELAPGHSGKAPTSSIVGRHGEAAGSVTLVGIDPVIPIVNNEYGSPHVGAEPVGLTDSLKIGQA